MSIKTILNACYNFIARCNLSSMALYFSICGNLFEGTITATSFLNGELRKKNMSLREYMIWEKNEDDRFCLEDKKLRYMFRDSFCARKVWRNQSGNEKL